MLLCACVLLAAALGFLYSSPDAVNRSLSYLTSRIVLVAPMLRLWFSILFTAGDDAAGGPPGGDDGEGDDGGDDAGDDAGDDGTPQRFKCFAFTFPGLSCFGIIRPACC